MKKLNGYQLPYGNIISRPFCYSIVLAITGAPANQLMAVIFSIVFISVLFYAMGLMTRVLKKDDSKDTSNTSLKNSQPLVCNARPVIYETVYRRHT